MKWLLALPILLASAPANADTVYLLIKSQKGEYGYSGLALHSIPMKSLDQCEEAGALVISSERFKKGSGKYDTFECIEGK